MRRVRRLVHLVLFCPISKGLQVPPGGRSRPGGGGIWAGEGGIRAGGGSVLPIRASRHKGMLRSAVPSAGDSDGMGTGDGHRDTVTGIEHPRWLHNAQLAALPACRCVRPSVRPSAHPSTPHRYTAVQQHGRLPPFAFFFSCSFILPFHPQPMGWTVRPGGALRGWHW